MEDRRSARSHGNDLKVWHIIPEHAPMLTSSLRRRSAHLPGLRAPSRQGADQTWGVGARRRQRSSASGSSFSSSTRIRKSSAAYISAPKVRFASCAPMHSKARRWPQAQPQGIGTASSRFAGGFDLPKAGSSRLASSLRPC